MSDSNNNFQDLKRLLKLKQHEVPPPGYFNNFSSDVMARIRAGEASGQESWLERIQGGSPLLASLLHLFEVRPGMIGAAATSLCLLLLVGVMLADHSDSSNSASIATSDLPQNTSAPTPTLAASAPLTAADNSGISVSTNPVTSLQPVSTLFGSSQNPLFQSAAFMPAGH